MNIVQNYKPCPIWVRILCIVYDLILAVCSLIAISFILYWLLPIIENNWHEHILFKFYMLLIPSAYFIGFWHKGQTPGMRIWKLTWTYNENQSPPLFVHCLRYSLFLMAIPGLLTCLIRKDKQSVVDLMCRTKLLKII